MVFLTGEKYGHKLSFCQTGTGKEAGNNLYPLVGKKLIHGNKRVGCSLGIHIFNPFYHFFFRAPFHVDFVYNFLWKVQNDQKKNPFLCFYTPFVVYFVRNFLLLYISSHIRTLFILAMIRDHFKIKYWISAKNLHKLFPGLTIKGISRLILSALTVLAYHTCRWGYGMDG